MMRRRVSVDFTIPEALPAFARMGKGRQVFFVPVALVRKWPPVMMWDLRDGGEESLPLLTSWKNARVDGEALLGLAPKGRLRECLRPMLFKIPEASEPEALEALHSMTTILEEHIRTLPVAELNAWKRAVWVAGTMVGNNVIWARTEGRVGQRQIVKFEFQQPVETELVLRRRILSAFSWGAIRVFLNLPNLGERGSYHLEVTPPPGMEISTLHPLSLSALPPGRWQAPNPRPAVWQRLGRLPYTLPRQLLRGMAMKLRLTFGGGSSGTGELPRFLIKPTPGEPYYWNAGERAYLYIQNTQNQFAVARIDMAVSRAVLLRGALIVSLIIAAFLSVATARTQAMISQVEPSVTLLLLVPGFLGLLVVRPGEHPLVTRHLAGVTFLVIASTALPAIAAFVLLIARHSVRGEIVANAHAIHNWWRALSWASWAIAFGLLCSWLLPVPERDER